MQRAARRARRRKQIETSDSASGTAGVSSAGERYERCNERRCRRVVGGRKKPAIQRAARRARRRKEKETSDSASGAAGESSSRETNVRCSERRGGQAVGKRKKRAMQGAAQCEWRQWEKEASDAVSSLAGAAGLVAVGERNSRCSERHGGRNVGERKKRLMQRAAWRA
jgi:hypothetical protein